MRGCTVCVGSDGAGSAGAGCPASPIAAAAAQTKHPVSQALVSMTQTFIDTLVVCTLTGLVLIVTGQWNSGLTGAELTGVASNSDPAWEVTFFSEKRVSTAGLKT